MYKQEKIKPYEGQGDKGKLVEEMFDNIAPTYDTLNHRLSWDIDKGWRKKAIKQLAPFRPQKMLDIATGTGDFAILSAQMLHPLQLIGTDISEVGTHHLLPERRLPEPLVSRQHLRCRDSCFRHTQFPESGPRSQRDAPRTEEGRTSEHSGTDVTRPLPYETAFPHLFTHRTAHLWQADFQRPKRLQLSYSYHRGFPSGRDYDGSA